MNFAGIKFLIKPVLQVQRLKGSLPFLNLFVEPIVPLAGCMELSGGQEVSTQQVLHSQNQTQD